MVATGDLRVNEEKQARARQAAEDLLAALDEMEANEANSTQSVRAKAEAQAAVRQAMLATGVRRIGAVRT